VVSCQLSVGRRSSKLRIVLKARLFPHMRSDHKRNGGSKGKASLAARKKPLAVPLTTSNRSTGNRLVLLTTAH
jgi:hypothetical protein